MKELDKFKCEESPLQTDAGNYRLEWFNGQTWEVGHRQHWNLTKEEWDGMKKDFKSNNKNNRWRLIKMVIEESANYE